MTTPAHDPWTDPEFEQAVRDTAYFLWENDGRPEGMEKEYWFRALERCLRQRDADTMLKQQIQSDSEEGAAGPIEGSVADTKAKLKPKD
jgi:hypothetical protein